MKKFLIILTILFSISLFSQKKYFIFYNQNCDKVIISKDKKIKFFKILVGKKEINFVLSDIKSNYSKKSFDKKNVITRDKLNEVISSDNANVDNKYIIVMKKNEIYFYYYVDHLIRTIID